MRPVKFTALAVFAVCSATLWSQAVNLYSYTVPSSGYAPNGNLTNYSDSITGTWSNQYDDLNRLKSTTSSAGPYNGLNIQWQYDSFGNRLSQTPTGSNTSLPAATTMRYEDGTNRITSSSIPGVGSTAYDNAGNLRFDGLNAIAYDAESRVCAVKNFSGAITQYLYNADGQRVAKGYSASGSGLNCPTPGDFVATEKYILGRSGEQITQFATKPDGSDVWQHTNVYANGQLIATYDQEGSQQLLHFQISDPLGTRRVQTSGSGSVEISFLNLPYGDGFNPGGSGQDATQQHFTGKERDTESGLDYFGARYYASTMGRFSSPDPSGLYYANPAYPQSLNLYSYVGNNPLIFTDPSGMDCVYTNNQTSDSVSVTTVRGDCLSDTDSGVYVNGTVNTSSYTYSGTSLGYQYSPDDVQGGTTTLGSGTIGLDAPASTQASIDPDNARISALVQGVAQNTAGFPNICSMSFSARGQIPFTPVKAGFSMDGQGKLSGSASWKQAGSSGSPSVSLTGRANANGGAVAQQFSIPIPNTPFSATLGVNPLGGRNSYGLSADLGKGFTASAAATFGTMGDPGCQKR